jgi:hypothetical protein
MKRNPIEREYLIKGFALGTITFLASALIVSPISGLLENVSAGFFGATLFYWLVEKGYRKMADEQSVYEDLNLLLVQFKQNYVQRGEILKSLDRRRKIILRLNSHVQSWKYSNQGELLDSLFELFTDVQIEQNTLVKLATVDSLQFTPILNSIPKITNASMRESIYQVTQNFETEKKMFVKLTEEVDAILSHLEDARHLYSKIDN